jgi:hypothetical protein
VRPEYQARCGLAAESYFRSIDAVDARLSTRRAAGWDDGVAREKTEFHQTAGYVFGEVEAIERPGFTFPELGKGLGCGWGISPV